MSSRRKSFACICCLELNFFCLWGTIAIVSVIGANALASSTLITGIQSNEELKLKHYTVFVHQKPDELAQYWDMSQGHVWAIGKTPDVHKSNPDFKSLLYRNFRAVYPYRTEEYAIFVENGWLAEDMYGKPVYSLNYPPDEYQIVDVGNPEYHTWVANWIKQVINQYDCDGVFLDNGLSSGLETFWNTTANYRIMNPRTGILYTDEEVRQAIVDCHIKIKQAIGNKLLVVNGIWTAERFYNRKDDYLDIFSRSPLNGFISEGLWFGGETEWMSLQSWGETVEFVTYVQNNFLISPNRVFVGFCPLQDGMGTWRTVQGATHEQVVEFVVASMLLCIKNDQNYLGMVGDVDFARDVIKPLLDIELGDPLNKYYRIENTDVYTRDFANVKVLVNPTEYTFVIDLGVRTISMQPHVGVGINQRTGRILFAVPSGELRRLDMNFDGAISIHDLFIGAKAFGSYPEHPRWNPVADLNYDDIVNLFDLLSVLKNFGKTIS